MNPRRGGWGSSESLASWSGQARTTDSRSQARQTLRPQRRSRFAVGAPCSCHTHTYDYMHTLAAPWWALYSNVRTRWNPVLGSPWRRPASSRDVLGAMICSKFLGLVPVRLPTGAVLLLLLTFASAAAAALGSQGFPSLFLG
ncbi:plasma membrane calcium-transporting ATPase 1 isoform X1 [Anopheles sinensis]|uniref:Plasma membrane calcium-transporting ATPase 1 isoform X1 n=1 Tax=Anopheles sinensis TaxID=74873 RepID=A0A084VCR0_ANOSI|nr:plasma membrane calcium-transporting ATPase 1 isoform X1 [Anopheles sinensis]